MSTRDPTEADFLRDVAQHEYTWCCYAIVWAIRQYDKSKSEAAA